MIKTNKVFRSLIVIHIPQSVPVNHSVQWKPNPRGTLPIIQVVLILQFFSNIWYNCPGISINHGWVGNAYSSLHGTLKVLNQYSDRIGQSAIQPTGADKPGVPMVMSSSPWPAAAVGTRKKFRHDTWWPPSSDRPRVAQRASRPCARAATVGHTRTHARTRHAQPRLVLTKSYVIPT